MYHMRPVMAWLLSTLLVLSPVLPAQAAMVGTGEIVNPTGHRSAETQVRRLLAEEGARRQLQEWGVDTARLEQRIAALSDSELARINENIDSLHAGGTNVLGVLLLIFILFVITDIIGATDIFPFVHPVK